MVVTREIKISGGSIPVCVEEKDGDHIITVDGVQWVKTDNRVHAAVLFNLMVDHLTEYMHYEIIK